MSIFSKLVGYPLTLIFGAGTASAGGLAPAAIEPQIEPVVIDESPSSSMGILPILALLVLIGVLASRNGDSQTKKAPVKPE